MINTDGAINIAAGSMAEAATELVYFELSWSILSTICLANCLFGLLVIGITSFSPISTVPIITSVAGAVANGLCYYAFYSEDYSTNSKAVASIFADLGWLIQEAGFSFYSYIILNRVLRDRKRWIFIIPFWTLIVGIAVARVLIAIHRTRMVLMDETDLQTKINHLHIVYFVLIAVVEIFSAFFLLRTFATAKSMSHKASLGTGLFRHLMRSTEVRMALLAVLGTMRAITYSFQVSAQSATDVAGQLDRFAYTMECLFPIIMLIDILASKLAFNNQGHEYYSSRSRHRNQQYGRQVTVSRFDDGGYASNKGGHIVTVQGGTSKVIRRTSSEEQIVDRSHGATPSDIGLESMDPGRIGISKTVEVEIHQLERERV